MPMEFMLVQRYIKRLAKALAKHFGARLMIVDSLLLLGLSFFNVYMIFAFKLEIYLCFLGILLPSPKLQISSNNS